MVLSLMLLTTAAISIGRTLEYLLTAMRKHELNARRNVKWEVAMHIASLAMSVLRLVEGALKHVRICGHSLRSSAKEPWLACVFKAGVLILEAVSFPIVDYLYGNVLGGHYKLGLSLDLVASIDGRCQLAKFKLC